MNAIEKRARELLAAELGDYESKCLMEGLGGVVTNREAMSAIMAALMLGGPVDLLDQHSAGGVQPEERNVIPPPTLGADEAGAVVIGQVASRLPRNVQLAEVASEHKAGVRPEGDGQATADHVAHDLKVVERARAMLASEYLRQGWAEFDAELGSARDRVAIAAIVAALTPPEGYVLVPVELVKAVEDLSLIYEAGGDIDSKLSETEAILAARSEVKP